MTRPPRVVVYSWPASPRAWGAMVVLLVVAFVLEAVGLVCAALGFMQTWHEHAIGQDFWAPAKARWAASTHWVDRQARRLLGRPARPRVVSVGGALSVGWAGSARATIRPGPLPDSTSDLSAFAAMVEQRIEQLYEMTQKTDGALADEVAAREAAEKEIRTTLTAEIDRVEGMSRQVAVGGLRLQVLGWSFLFVGLVLGSIGNVWQALSS